LVSPDRIFWICSDVVVVSMFLPLYDSLDKKMLHCEIVQHFFRPFV